MREGRFGWPAPSGADPAGRSGMHAAAITRYRKGIAAR